MTLVSPQIGGKPREITLIFDGIRGCFFLPSWSHSVLYMRIQFLGPPNVWSYAYSVDFWSSSFDGAALMVPRCISSAASTLTAQTFRHKPQCHCHHTAQGGSEKLYFGTVLAPNLLVLSPNTRTTVRTCAQLNSNCDCFSRSQVPVCVKTVIRAFSLFSTTPARFLPPLSTHPYDATIPCS